MARCRWVLLGVVLLAAIATLCGVQATAQVCGSCLWLADGNNLGHEEGGSKAPSPTTAGATELESRLPASVKFYVHWRGTKSVDPKNGLARLWADPDFASMRQKLLEKSFKRSGGSKSGQQISPEQAAALLPLFENEAITGSMAPIDPTAPARAADNGFFIYAGADKAQLIQQAIALREKQPAQTGTKKSYMLGDVKIESEEKPDGTQFSAQVRDYYVSASKKEIIEELVTRLGAKQAAPGLTDYAEWQKARATFVPGALADVFVRLSAHSLDVLGKVDKFDAQKFAGEVHLDGLHAVTASLFLGSDATRFKFSILGDTSSPSLFDLAGASSADFATLPLARVGASYNVGRLNFQGLYKILIGPVFDSLPANESGMLKGFEAMAAGFLGMPLPDALALLGGEEATVSEASAKPTSIDLFALSIHDRDNFLKLVRKILGKEIHDEQQSGDATIISIAAPAFDPKTKQMRQDLSYIAVTPQLAIYSQHKEILDDALARLHGSHKTDAEPLAGNADFQRMRALLPASLSGFSYSPLSKDTWNRGVAPFLAGLHATQTHEQPKQAPATPKNAPKGEGNPSPQDLPAGLTLEVFSRYVHSYVSGSWKAADGVYFDSYLQ